MESLFTILRTKRGLGSDFVKVRRPRGALWKGAMVSPIANMDSMSSKGKKGRKDLLMRT